MPESIFFVSSNAGTAREVAAIGGAHRPGSRSMPRGAGGDRG